MEGISLKDPRGEGNHSILSHSLSLSLSHTHTHSLSLFLTLPIVDFSYVTNSQKHISGGPEGDDEEVRIRKRACEDLGDDDTVRMAISALQHVLSADFQPEEVEVSIATKDGGFYTMGVDEIEGHLTAISERD